MANVKDSTLVKLADGNEYELKGMLYSKLNKTIISYNLSE